MTALSLPVPAMNAPSLGNLLAWDGGKYEPSIGLTWSGTTLAVGGAQSISGTLSVADTNNASILLAIGALNATNSVLTGTSNVGIQNLLVGTSGATSNIRAYGGRASTTAAAYTCALAVDYLAFAVIAGAGSTITRAFGFVARPQTVGTSNFAMFVGTESSTTVTGTWAFYNETTDPSYFNGAVTQAKGQGWGVTNTATAAGTTTLTSSSTVVQVFTGTTTQTVTLPAANLLGAGIAVMFVIKNRSTGNVTVNRAGSDTIDGATSVVIAGGASETLASDGVSDWVRI